MNPIIISVAPNGARKTTSDHPNIPVTPETMARAAKDFQAAGAAQVHLHIRDKHQKHTLDVGIYRETIAAIREQVGEKLIIQVTSEAVEIYTPEQQMAMVRELKPEAVSLALRELFPENADAATAKRFFHDVVEMGALPQYILYSPQEVRRFAQLRKDGVIPGKAVNVLFVLGRKTGNPERASDAWAQPDDLLPFLECFDGAHGQPALKLAETHWAVCGFGGNEDACMRKVVASGGHPRIGFENNHLLKDGSVAEDNAALVRQFCANALNRPIASAAEAREILLETREF